MAPLRAPLPIQMENEQRIRSLWASTLNIQPGRISRDATFFGLGGDSVAAMQAAFSARTLDLPITYSDLLATPKLADLAQVVSDAMLGFQETQTAPFEQITGDTASTLRQEAASQCQVAPGDIEDLIPCTALQQSVWSDMVAGQPGTERYTTRLVFRLPDYIDLDRFQDAWNTTLLWHPILRVRLVKTASDGLLQTVIQGNSATAWRTTDSFENFLNQDQKDTMTFGTPLSRYTLIVSPTNGVIFVWTTHHSIVDRWSRKTIQDAVVRAYNHELLSSPTHFKIAKADAGLSAEAAAAFWASHLESPDLSFFPAVTSSGAFKPNATISKWLPWAYKPPKGISRATFLKAAWAIVAGTYSGSRDVIFGTTMSGGSSSAPISFHGTLSSPTTATVPVRVRWEPSMTPLLLMEGMRGEESGARPFAQAGLSNIARINSDTAGACQFSCLFEVEPSCSTESARITKIFGVEDPENSLEGTGAALHIRCGVSNDELNISVQFDDRAVDRERLVHVMLLLENTITAMGSNMEASISSLQLTTTEDHRQILRWNAEKPTVVRQMAHELFRLQARLRPDHIALSSWDGEMTYAQLDDTTDRLAGHLSTLGVGPEVLVPICFEKSIWAIVAMLGVLKAGGAFAVIEPSHPLDRKAVIAQQLQAKIAIVAPSTEALFPTECVGAVVVCDSNILQLPLPLRPLQVGGPESAMYVIFTSGSTGTPKGCVTEHWAFCSSMYEFGRDSGMGPDCQVLQFASYSFDTSLEETFCTLFAGATLHIPSEWARINDLAGEIQRTRTNWAELNPKVLSTLMPEEVPTLETIILGGDRSHGSDVCRWPETTRLLNSYGCTEASVTSTLILLGKRDNEAPPIGKGVGCTLWIVDPDNHDRLVPVGAPGELLIEGPGLARGYLHDPERTGKSFIVNPAWAAKESGADRRFYKTGDIVHYNDEGAVLYHGRKDTQIKLRGQRIELGEIEHQLAQALPDARVSVEIATMQPGSAAPDTLAAFVVFPGLGDQAAEVAVRLDDATVQELADVRPRVVAALSRALPAYMVPSIFIPISRMPWTISAKVDRRKLRAVAEGLGSAEIALLEGADDVKHEPQSDAEISMQAVWADVLSRSPASIGLGDNFFRIGGDSIVAMKLVPAARRQGLHICVADIFQSPVLKDLAAKATSGGQQTTLVDNVPPFSLVDQDAKETLIREAAVQCGLQPDEIEDLYPCTPLQEGLLSLSAKQDGSYIMREVMVLAKDVRMSDFHRAWDIVIEAHPILRTRIVSAGSRMLQAVTTRRLSWETSIDLDHYIERDSTQKTGFGIPLSRYAIIPYYDRFFFVWTVHHSVYDGWTLPIILGDVAKVYHHGSLGNTAPAGFNRFIKHLSQADGGTAAAFWSSYLDGPSATFPAALSVDQVAEPTATLLETAGFVASTVDGVTATTVLRAAWALVTRSYTGDSDVCFGITVSGRNAPVHGIEHMSGPTIATVPFRLREDAAQGPATVRSLLKSVQDAATSIMPFEQTGLQSIARASEDAQAACRFGTLFVVQPEDDEENVEVARLMRRLDTSREGFDESTTQPMLVECTMDPKNESIRIRIRYDPKLVDPAIVNGMARQLKHILAQLADPERLDHRLEDLDLINPADVEQARRWNRERIRVVNETMHGLFGAAAATYAARPAISAWDGEMTYSELDAASSQVAGRLRSLGIGGSSGEREMVLLCFEKSRWAVVSALAILKAGAAFVALDAAQPDDRLATIMALSKARLILTSSTLEPRLSQISKGAPNVLCTAALAGDPRSPLVPFVSRRKEVGSHALLSQVTTSPADLAYIIFTSGSTGVPKGVMISHGAAASSMMAHGAAFGVDCTSRTLQFSSLTFDASIFEVFTTLATGGCVCIPSDSERVNDLAAAINSLSINTAMLTPSVLALLAPESVPSLRSIIFIAEQVTKSDIERWHGQCRIQNGYGPTECTVVCVVNPDLRDGGRIGYATGCRAWVVQADNVNKLVPVGCVGELIIEGPSLAIGYLNDEERTAASFILDPDWSRHEGGFDPDARSRRFYKTGDLVQQTSDGSYLYLGRKDTQVKLRGQRIELGEVDFHIRRALPAATVRSDIVQLQQQNGGDATVPALAAFIVTDSSGLDIEMGESLSAQLVAQLGEATSVAVPALSQSVPPYMIPSIFIPVSQMPLTVSGKTDRLKLKAIAAKIPYKTLDALRGVLQGSDSRGPKEAPTNDLERAMHSAWAVVLQLEPSAIGINDNFFRLGGDSIAAMKLVTAARSQGISITVAQVFKTPVLADLCRLGGHEKAEVESVAPFSLLAAYSELMHQDAAQQCKVAPEDLVDLYPSTPLQQGLMSLSIKQDGSYIIRDVFRLRGVEIHRFQRAWDAVARASPILRTRLVYLDTHGTLQAVLNTQPAIEWHVAGSLEEYIAEDKKQRMGLGTPLTRYGLIQPADPSEDALFVWTAHHAIYDGWSMPIIKEAVATAYMGMAIPDAPAFNTFIKHIGEADSSAADSFWQSYLQGAGASQFPILSHTQVQEYRADRVENLAVPWSWQQKEGVTVSTLLRAAYALIVGAYTGSRDVVFGTTLSGRNVPVPDIESMMGPTIVTVPLRVAWSSESTIKDLLLELQSKAAEMTQFEQVGIRRISKLGDSAKDACQFLSLFVVQPEWNEESAACAGLFGDLLETLESGAAAMHQTYPLGIEASYSSSLGELQLTATYDSRIINSEETGRVLKQLGHVASLLGKNLNAPLSSLDLVGPHDLGLIQQWNSQGPPPGIREAVYDIINGNAAARPDAMAISACDGDLTYTELTAISNGLAQRLRAMGVGLQAETIVALSHGKSKWVPVMMLAILKAGGAFVALDPDQPISRLKYIVEEAGITILLTSPELGQNSSLASLPVQQIYPQSFVYTDGEQAETPEQVHGVPAAESLAYVVFTSGSTGTPKGVMVSHSATASSTLAHGSGMGINENSRVLQFSSYTFDACVLEIFGSLLAGACVCIPSKDECAGDLNQAILKYSVNFAALTPRVASLLRPEKLPAIKSIALGAEVVTTSDIQRWQGRRVSNGYGPTECTVVCVLESTNHKPGRIGKGVGCVCWIVDPEDSNQLAPVGAPGELLIEGPCLAMRYLHQEEKTNASFVRNLRWARASPGAHHAPRRFYKTGDIVRYDTDGGILFIGRKDTQAKLRGQRIELAEVEHHLGRLLPGYQVIADIVSFPQQKNDSMALVAFVVPPNVQQASSGTKAPAEAGAVLALDSDPATELSRKWCGVASDMSQSVPTYMVPSMYVPLTRIPLTTSSKRDKKRLQEIVQCISGADLELLRGVQAVKEPPRNAAEMSILSAWAQVLGLEPAKIGIRDSFFSLGGDSISAMRFISVVAEKGVTLRVADVFKHPVLMDLAINARKGPTHRRESSNDDWSDIASNNELGASSDGSFEAGILQKLAGSSDDMSSSASQCTNTTGAGPGLEKYQLAPALDFQALTYEFHHMRRRGFVNYFVLHFSEFFCYEHIRNACAQLVRHHSVLRTRLKLVDGRLWQLIAPAESAQAAVANLHVGDDGLDPFVARLIEIDEACRLSSDELENPLKFFIVQSASSSRLVIRLGHPHYDGICFPALLQTLTHTLRGHPATSLVPDVPFHQYASRIHSLPMGPSLDYWRQLLDGSRLTPVITPAAVSANDGVVGVITRLVPMPDLSRAGITFATVLKAAWALVLARHSAATDVVFGCLVSGRIAPVEEAEAVVGPCLTLVPVRTRLDDNTTARSFLQLVHDQQTQGMEHEHIGLRRITNEATSWAGQSSSLAGASVVQHQNIPLAAELNEILPDLPFELRARGSTANAAAVWIITTARPADSLLSIDFEYARLALGTQLAETLLQGLCEAIEFFGQNWNADVPLPPHTISSPGNSAEEVGRRPVQLPILPYGANESSRKLLSSGLAASDRARGLVNQAWDVLFKAHSTTGQSWSAHTSMLEVWSDNLVAVAMRGIYERLGVCVDLEQLLLYPAVWEQELLVTSLGYN